MYFGGYFDDIKNQENLVTQLKHIDILKTKIYTGGKSRFFDTYLPNK